MRAAGIFTLLVAIAGCGGTAQPQGGAGGHASGGGGHATGSGGAGGSDGGHGGGGGSGGSGGSGGGAPKASWSSQVIYLVMPDRFQNGDPSNDASGNPGCFDPQDPSKWHGGDLAGLRNKVGYLNELGVTALWITPVYKQSPDRCGYHGYWADFADPDDGAIEPKLGTIGDLQGLIDDLHAGGIRFILDMVANHAGRNAQVVNQHPDWFHDPATCASLGPVEVFCPIGGKPLPDFAQEKPEVASYLTSSSVGWETRIALDGVRMDTVKHVPVTYWKSSWLPGMKAKKSDLFVVGEVFDTGPADHLKPFLDAGFDSLFNFPLMAELVKVFAGGASVSSLASKLQEEIGVFGQARTRMLTTFLNNHDLPRFASIPTGVAPDEIHRRQLLGLGALLTLPGIPQLYYGDELGLLGGKDPDNRRDMPSWAFDSATRAQNHPADALPSPQETFARVQKLIQIRKQNPALIDGDYVELWRQNGQGANVMAFLRGDGVAPIVVALNNGDTPSGPTAMKIQANGAISAADHALLAEGAMLDEQLGAGAPASLTISQGKLTISLPPKTIGIYRLH